MTAGGSTVTCLPVQLADSGEGTSGITNAPEDSASSRLPLEVEPDELSDEWQSAIFFRLGGQESRRDIQLLRQQSKVYGVGIETDIIEHANASVVILRLQLFITEDDPLVGEVLLTPGGARTHYEVLGLLGRQAELTWFCSDQEYHLIHQQKLPLSQEWRDEFLALRSESFKRDAILRLAGKYSAQTAFAEIVSNYGLR